MNVRLHCYVRVRGIAQKDNATEAVVFSSYMCDYCSLKCQSLLHRRNHLRYCSKNPDKERTKAKRAKADDRGDHCSPCNRSFDKRSMYHQHNCRRHPKKPKVLHTTESGKEESEGAGEDSERERAEEREEERAEEGEDESEEESKDESEGKGQESSSDESE
ncbi:hypothetical protein V7S43_011510 [Phytophthora oleae]|uniref:C2H2-type domain-containing protein n=1 Tax=Phytophthora oleae TaxID=2107226 RepID=A0ABD3FDR2_9STRA